MKITIHQPEHLPWLGLLDKVHQADLWVILDDVQYRRRYFQNRNKIRTSDGWVWLTVPVHSVWGETLINGVTIANDTDWQSDCWKTMHQNYSPSSYFEQYADFFASVYSDHWEYLVDLNLDIIRYLLECFDIQVETMLNSDLSSSGEASDLILSICKEVGASVYISGISGKDYLEKDDFHREGIEVEFQEFYHPIYRQCYEPFMPCMSSVDLLFNYGPEARQVLFDPSTPRLDHVFD